MKIAIVGYSGSGKSTLARTLGERMCLPVLHLDQVQFLPGWQTRDKAEQQRLVTEFLDGHESWIVDGNYASLSWERRMAEADRIVVLLFGRIACLRRVVRRRLAYRGRTRPDVTQGCPEKLDGEFLQWVLRDGRSERARSRYLGLRAQYPDKTAVLRTQRALDDYLRKLR